MEVRYWLPGPRILGSLVRPGISLWVRRHGPALVALPRYELRKGLQEAAKARGEPMTKEDADYCIDKALANGVLDSAGDLNFVARGNREEIIAEILQKGATWNIPMPRDEGERLTNQAVRNKLCRGSRIFLIVALVAIAGREAQESERGSGGRSDCKLASQNAPRYVTTHGFEL